MKVWTQKILLTKTENFKFEKILQRIPKIRRKMIWKKFTTNSKRKM